MIILGIKIKPQFITNHSWNHSSKNTQNKNAIKYLYDGKEFYGWRKLKKYLNENGYSKISEATIVKLSNGLSVRGYDDLFGKIITNKDDKQKGGKL